MSRSKPILSFWQIWNMCFGFLGLQFAFALQNANMSRIFQQLGASLEQVPLLWIAAPLSGLLLQPVIGYWSDRTWTRLGRRRPFFLAGAVLASTALVLMPRSPTLWVAAALLWMLDGAINISMEPFRAFVGDQLHPMGKDLWAVDREVRRTCIVSIAEADRIIAARKARNEQVDTSWLCALD